MADGTLTQDQEDALNADITKNVTLSEKKGTKIQSLTTKIANTTTQKATVTAEQVVVNEEIGSLLINYTTLTGDAVPSEWEVYEFD